jgi:hypothetical protein
MIAYALSTFAPPPFGASSVEKWYAPYCEQLFIPSKVMVVPVG